MGQSRAPDKIGSFILFHVEQNTESLVDCYIFEKWSDCIEF